MCGRFTLSSDPEDLAERFGLDEVPALEPRYNIAPTQRVATVRLVVPAETRGAPLRRELRLARWGLVPSWAKDPSIGNRMINARAETVGSKPAFRSALRRRRCLVLADGFYEWKRVGRGKQPFHIRRPDGAAFAFAGLHERWVPPEGEPLETCTLLTTEPSEVVAAIHDRMPVILEPGEYERWLDPAVEEPAALTPLLRPYAGPLVAYPVSPRVNSPGVDDPSCIAPLVDPA